MKYNIAKQLLVKEISRHTNTGASTLKRIFAKHLCLEPWCGIPDFVDSDFDISKKKGIICLGKGENTIRTHKILF